MSKNKVITNSNAISKIIITNSIGDEFYLEMVSDNKLKSQKYKEIFVSEMSLLTGNVSQTALQVANQSMTLAQILEQAPNGLFTATTNPINLSKFINGTSTTMVRDASNHLVEHAGFRDIGLNVSLNPTILISAGLQAMSAVSGTVYLYKIHSQMISLDVKLEKLLSRYDDTNIGYLIATKKGLSEIINREFVDKVDLYAIRDYKKTVNETHEIYMRRLEKEKELPTRNDSKAEDKMLEEIEFAILIAYEASKLSLLAEVIEIRTRMKIGDQVERLDELSRQLKQNYYNSFYYNIDLEIEKAYSNVLQRSNKNLLEKKIKIEQSLDLLTNESTYFSRDKIPELWFKSAVAGKNIIDLIKANKKIGLETQSLVSLVKDIKQNKVNDGIDNIIDKIVDLPYKENEILYIPMENNKQRMFVGFEDE